MTAPRDRFDEMAYDLLHAWGEWSQSRNDKLARALRKVDAEARANAKERAIQTVKEQLGMIEDALYDAALEGAAAMRERAAKEFDCDCCDTKQYAANIRALPLDPDEDKTPNLDLHLLAKLASGEGGRRTGALKRAGLLEWSITDKGHEALKK